MRAWRVAIGEAVDGVDADDFILIGASATLRAAGVWEDAYGATATGGELTNSNGSVTLWFADAVSVNDSAGNAPLEAEPTRLKQATFHLENLDE